MFTCIRTRNACVSYCGLKSPAIDRKEDFGLSGSGFFDVGCWAIRGASVRCQCCCRRRRPFWSTANDARVCQFSWPSLSALMDIRGPSVRNGCRKYAYECGVAYGHITCKRDVSNDICIDMVPATVELDSSTSTNHKLYYDLKIICATGWPRFCEQRDNEEIQTANICRKHRNCWSHRTTHNTNL